MCNADKTGIVVTRGSSVICLNGPDLRKGSMSEAFKIHGPAFKEFELGEKSVVDAGSFTRTGNELATLATQRGP